MVKDDGGPAFARPFSADMRFDGSAESAEYAQAGMSLRDYFAAKALASIGEDVHSVLYHVDQITGYDATGDAAALTQAKEKARKIAIACDLVADAMLAAQKK